MYIIAYYVIAAKCTSSPKILNITTTKPQGGTHLSTYTHTQVLIVHLQVRDTQRQIQGLLKPWEQDAEEVGSDHFYHLWRLQLFRQEASHMVPMGPKKSCMVASVYTSALTRSKQF